MLEPRTTITYEDAFAKARSERAAAFRDLMGFGNRRETARAEGWSLLRRFANA